MINVGKWRWPIIVCISLSAGWALFWFGMIRCNFVGQGVLQFSGDAAQIDEELNIFRFHPVIKSDYDRVTAQPNKISVRVQGDWPGDVVNHLTLAAKSSIDRSYGKQKAKLSVIRDDDQKKVADKESELNRLMEERNVLVAGPRENTSKAQLVAQIEELKSRRRQLIEHYPSHTDIPVLAQRIQGLLKRLGKPSGPAAEKITDLDRRINEIKLRRDYFARGLQQTEKLQKDLKPSWTLLEPVEKPKWPTRVEGWPTGAGLFVGVFLLCWFVFRQPQAPRADISRHGLWRQEINEQVQAAEMESVAPETRVAEETPTVPETPVALEVVHPELPSDPLTEKAAELYARWVETAKILYSPAADPPQGVLDKVGPLLQDSSDFLPEGHDVLAKYLARSVTPGDLPAHVARTVLMTLTGAQEAGVSPEHRLAMALAALFHDLAVVARPAPAQDNVGSEVGRLSASVLHRIPGLQPALLSMVEEILIGMDEFKLETWQNVANGRNLEPLSKVLREIDRFEKVMQKQKARLDRRAPTARVASQ